MQPDTPPIALPALEALIDPHPLTTSPDTPLADVIPLMGQARTMLGLSGSRPITPEKAQTLRRLTHA
ncbi:MAG: hypothetical protein LDL41_07620, partial [Coleofasciculus sp. S288]|nr:hypothetical protein [Coleofasciculus sp. S288]